ncbi:unnamed protein product [Caenorhabditis nigoni]
MELEQLRRIMPTAEIFAKRRAETIQRQFLSFHSFFFVSIKSKINLFDFQFQSKTKFQQPQSDQCQHDEQSMPNFPQGRLMLLSVPKDVKITDNSIQDDNNI